MRLTRWKLLAGVLGLSMCGLAALAEPACRSMGFARRADEPKPDAEKPADAAKPPPPLPSPLPPPASTEVPPPVIPTVEDKKTAPAPLPSPVPVDAKPIALPPVNDPKTPAAVDIKLLEDVHKVQNPPVALPTLSEGKKADPVPLPVPSAIPSHEPLPTPVPVPYGTPGPDTPRTAVPAPALVGIEPIVPVKSEKPLPLPAAEKNVDLPLPGVTPIPSPATEAPKAAGVVNKKLKVMLHLSDEKPWFEVRDGEDLVLKVTADAVNLSASAEKGKPAGVLVALGGVQFRTLGGYGTCDELQVMPGTGEVVVTGKVTVTSNWGKAETTATADKMTFRLGTDAKK